MNIAKKRFRDAKYCAQRRGIDFELTFNEWYAWWLSHGVDKHIKTGSANGTTLAMCRNYDIGPYRLDNIYCDTMSNNNKHSWALQKRNQTAKGQGRKRSLATPLGIFESIRGAAKAQGISDQNMQDYIKRYPNEYRYLS